VLKVNACFDLIEINIRQNYKILPTMAIVERNMSYWLLVTGYWLLVKKVTGYGAAGQRATGCRLQATEDWLRTSDFGLRTSDFGLRSSDFGLRTSDFGLLIL